MQLVVATGRDDQPLHVEADRDHLDLPRPRDLQVDQVGPDLVGNGDNAIAGMRERPLEDAEEVLLGTAEVTAQDVAVEGVDDSRRADEPGCRAPHGAGLRAVGVDDVGSQPAELAPALSQRLHVVRAELARHLLQHHALDAELVGDRLHRTLTGPRLAVQQDAVPAEPLQERRGVDGLQDGPADRQA